MTKTIRARDYLNKPRGFRKAIRLALKSELCGVTFIKADGTKREMWCSLHPTFLLPFPEKGPVVKPKPLNIDILKVWDIESSAWRTFRLDSVIKLVYEE